MSVVSLKDLADSSALAGVIGHPESASGQVFRAILAAIDVDVSVNQVSPDAGS